MPASSSGPTLWPGSSSNTPDSAFNHHSHQIIGSRAHHAGAQLNQDNERGQHSRAKAEVEDAAQQRQDEDDDDKDEEGEEENDQDDQDEDQDEDEDDGGDDDDDDDGESADDDGSSPLASPDVEEDDEDDDEEEDDSPFKFLQSFDPALFAAGFGTPGATGQTALGATPTNDQSDRSRASRPPTSDPEFYSNMIQMLTHLLGSSDHGLWQGPAHTPGNQVGASPMQLPYSSPAASLAPTPSASRPVAAPHQRSADADKSNRSLRTGVHPTLPDLQPLINALISRVGGDHHSPRHPVGEQDLTDLLQSLMQQQQRIQEQQQQLQLQARNDWERQRDQQRSSLTSAANDAQQLAWDASSSNRPFPLSGATADSQVLQPISFANLNFEEEDEDDPDFNPDMNPDLPLPSAWSMAVQDIVDSEASKAAAAARRASGHSPIGREAALAPGLTPETGANTLGGNSPVSPMPPQLRSSDTALHAGGLGLQTTERSGSEENRGHGTGALLAPQSHDARSARESPSTRAPSANLEPHPATESRPRHNTANHESVEPSDDEDDDADEDNDDGNDGSAPGSSTGKRKRGRKAVYSEQEAARRRRERNAEYARNRRRRQKEEREAQQSVTGASVDPLSKRATSSKPQAQLDEDTIELRIENKMLRAELDRLRDENADLREDNARLRAYKELKYLDHGRAPISSRRRLADSMDHDDDYSRRRSAHSRRFEVTEESEEDGRDRRWSKSNADRYDRGSRMTRQGRASHTRDTSFDSPDDFESRGSTSHARTSGKRRERSASITSDEETQRAMRSRKTARDTLDSDGRELGRSKASSNRRSAGLNWSAQDTREHSVDCDSLGGGECLQDGERGGGTRESLRARQLLPGLLAASGLDAAGSRELARLLEHQQQRQHRRH